MITLDTSAVLALVNRNDRHHGAARSVLDGDVSVTVVPASILSEIAWVVGSRVGDRGVRSVLAGVIHGSTLLDCGDADLPRVVELLERYRHLTFGFSDAAVVACAERNGGSILTFDRGDLEIVSRDVPIALLP